MKPGDASCKKVADPATFSDAPASVGNRDKQYKEYTGEFQGRPYALMANTELEATMNDRILPIVTRVKAWIIRKSRGNLCLYCVNDDRNPAYQVDCAKELGLSEPTVSKTMKFLEQRGHLDRRGPAKILYSVLEPVLGPDPVKHANDPAYQDFFENWKVASQASFEEMETALAAKKVAESTIKKIKKLIESDYRELRRAQETAGHDVYKAIDTKDSKQEDFEAAPFPAPEHLYKPSASSSPSVSSEPTTTVAAVVEIAPRTPAPPPPVTDPDETEQVLAAMLEHSEAEPDAARRMIAACREFAPDASAEDICRHIDGKGRLALRRDNPVGFLLTVVPKTFERWRKPPGQANNSLSDEEAERIRSDTDRKLAMGGE